MDTNKKKPTSLIFESVPLPPANTEPNDKFEEYCMKLLATTAGMTEESIYVINPYEPCFRFVSPGSIFPCAHSGMKIQRSGFDRFSEAVHPDDLPLVMQAYKAAVNFLYIPDVRPDDLAYIVFDFRICRHKKYLPVCHKMTPVIIDDRVRFIYCTVTDSVCETAGNLIAYYKTGEECMHYSFESYRWNRKSMTTITPQENEILILSRFGYSVETIADYLCLSPKTIQNKRTELFKKLEAKNIKQALILARNNRLHIA